jgi:hypothetical protein
MQAKFLHNPLIEKTAQTEERSKSYATQDEESLNVLGDKYAILI